jgi:hypothetical protein
LRGVERGDGGAAERAKGDNRMGSAGGWGEELLTNS